MPQIAPFEKHSELYDEWFERHHDLYEAELEAIRQLVPPPGTRGVEVGVGSGKFAKPLGIKIGVEPAEKMALKAKKQGISVCRGVAENLPFPDACFDFVLLVTTICFVDDVIKSFREAYRVLKPKGGIIVGFVDKQSDLGKQYLAKKEKSKFYKYATFFSTQEVLKYLLEASFEIVKIKQTLVPGQLSETIVNGFGEGGFVVIKGIK